MYGFWLPLWYLQTLLTVNYKPIFKLLEKQSFFKLCLSFNQSQMICSIHITLQDFETHFKIFSYFFYWYVVLFITNVFCSHHIYILCRRFLHITLQYSRLPLGASLIHIFWLFRAIMITTWKIYKLRRTIYIYIYNTIWKWFYLFCILSIFCFFTFIKMCSLEMFYYF